jgi:hypothetical protein
LHLRLLLAVPAAALTILGGEGLYHAVRGRSRASIDCRALAGARPSSHALRVTGCEIDYAGVGFRGGSGGIEELFFPARPAGSRAAAPLVVVTRNPAVLALAGTAVGSSRTIAPDQSLGVLQKAAAIVTPNQTIDGLVRAGSIERWRTRRILSGLTSTPVSADAMLIDLEGAPDFLRPATALAGALLLAALAFGLPRRAAPAPAGPRAAAPAPPPYPMVLAAERPSPPALSQAVTLPRLLLLNLPAGAGPDAVETAPPLGGREQVIEILRGVVPDLAISANRRALYRDDNSLRLDLGAADTVATTVVEARGEPGAALVKEILLMTGWRAFAPKTGLFVSGDELAVMAALASDRPATRS